MLLGQRELPSVVAHGDLKGENILLYTGRRGEKNRFKLIDLEWVGRTDWTEALMRMGKYCSTKTSEVIGTPHYSREGGVITLHYELQHRDFCVSLQQKARELGARFHTEVCPQDINWRKRFDLYLAASLLREIVLLQQRGLPPSHQIALWGEIIKIVSKYM